VRQLGDVHDRTDTQPGAPRLRVVVVSHDLYNQGTGTAFVCPVYEGSADLDYPLFVRCPVAGVPSLIIPDQVYRIPVLGLGDRPVDTLGEADLAQVRASIRGIFA
jgi:mRNA-degrading endonuclease toxin of MazEF toxin-antitoxin module